MLYVGLICDLHMEFDEALLLSEIGMVCFVLCAMCFALCNVDCIIVG